MAVEEAEVEAAEAVKVEAEVDHQMMIDQILKIPITPLTKLRLIIEVIN